MKLDDSLLPVPNPLSRRKNCSVLWIKLVRFIVVSLFGITEMTLRKEVASGTQESHSRARVRVGDSLAHRRIIAPAARLPSPVFTGAAPLSLGGSPAGLPTQLIRLWQGTSHSVFVSAWRSLYSPSATARHYFVPKT